MNAIKTAFLLGLMSSLLLLGGQAIAGRNGLVMALGLAIAMNFVSFFFSDKIALSMYRAEPVSPSENPQVWRLIGPMTQRLCQRMGLPMPKLWLVPDHSPNAFATGRGPASASVAVTAGILELMDEREIEGVIAHELGHILHRDILISSIAAMIGSAISSIAQFGYFFGATRHSDDEDGAPNPVFGLLMMIVAPIAAMVIQMAISRTREYSADAAAAKYTGSSYGLISALQKLEGWSHRIPMDASPSTAHMMIIAPFSGGGLTSLFSTHPKTEDRIAALRRLA
jgi:heat shock protein HtpX